MSKLSGNGKLKFNKKAQPLLPGQTVWHRNLQMHGIVVHVQQGNYFGGTSTPDSTYVQFTSDKNGNTINEEDIREVSTNLLDITGVNLREDY